MTQAAQTQATKSAYELPPAIAGFAGEINDIDSHEATPASLWTEVFDARTAEMTRLMFEADRRNTKNEDGYLLAVTRSADDTEINPETVWKSKMEMAPSAWDMDRRMEVLDFTGIRRQILYPGAMALRALNVHARSDDKTFFSFITGDRKQIAKDTVDAYNDWCIRTCNAHSRLSAVSILFEDTAEDLYKSAKRMIEAGVRGILLPTGRPPGGVSPAHPALDPLWDLLSQTRTPLLSHIGTNDDVLRTSAWRDAPAFDGWKSGAEFAFDPWTLSTLHLGIQNFVTAMVQGGVFERFPNLYLACNEFGAHWVGPLAENMDLWVRNQPFKNTRGFSYLKMMPSEYVRRNIRVAPFYFEDVGLYIERFGLQEVFCYGSDFPHHEGGKDPMGDFTRSLQAHGLGQDMLRKFFVDNARVVFGV
jgi:predicted TIM-barrel fold metal-dependent hydrolase